MEEEKTTEKPDALLDSIDNKINKIDHILTSFKKVWKKHWGIILVIAFAAVCYFGYGWASNLPEPDQAAPTEDTTYSEPQGEYAPTTPVQAQEQTYQPTQQAAEEDTTQQE